MDKRMTKIGEVVADKAEKTVTVLVSRVKEHPVYKKKYKISKKFRAHDEKNEYKIGDTVEIAPGRPLSKYKKFQVIRKVK